GRSSRGGIPPPPGRARPMTRVSTSTISPPGRSGRRNDARSRDGEPIAPVVRPAHPNQTHPARPGPCRGVVFVSQRRPRMFEDQSQREIETLMDNDREFRQLYQHHKKLDKKVMDAELGVLPMDPDTVAQW